MYKNNLSKTKISTSIQSQFDPNSIKSKHRCLGNMGVMAAAKVLKGLPSTIQTKINNEIDNELLRSRRLKKKYDRIYSFKKAASVFGEKFEKIVSMGKIKVSKYQSMINCLRYSNGEKFHMHKDSKGRPFYSGLQTCKKPECPNCGPKIASRRAKEVRKAIDNTYNKVKGSVQMATFTIPHYGNQCCKEVLTNLISTYRSFNSHRIFKNIYKEMGIFGSITSKETTFSITNGWHHHLHVLYPSEIILNDNQKLEFTERLQRHWINSIKKNNLLVKNDKALVKHAFKIDYCISSSDYLAKQNMTGTAGDLELTLSNNKDSSSGKGMHPLQLLDKYDSTNESKYALKYLEYIDSMHRTQRIAFSKCLKNKLDISHKTDEELLEEEHEKAVESSLEFDQVHLDYISRNRLHHTIKTLASKSFDDVVLYFKNHGFQDVRIVETRNIRNIAKEKNDRLIYNMYTDIYQYQEDNFFLDPLVGQFSDDLNFFRKVYSNSFIT